MSAIEGYCMKCKTYGPIKDGQKIAMANGRTRMAGFCSQEGCTGKISKIMRDCITRRNRIGLIEMVVGSVYLGLVV